MTFIFTFLIIAASLKPIARYQNFCRFYLII